MTYIAIANQLVAILKNMTRFKETMTADTLSFDAATKTIADSASGLGWIKAGDSLKVDGSLLNDGSYTVATAAAGSLTVVEDLADELAGEDVTLTAPTHVTDGNYSVMERGIDETAVIVPGPFQNTPEPQNRETYIWTAYIDLFERFIDETTTWTNFATMRDDVISTLKQYPALDQSSMFIKEVRINAEDALELYNKQGQGPFFIWQRVRVDVTEGVSVTGGDYQ